MWKMSNSYCDDVTNFIFFIMKIGSKIICHKDRNKYKKKIDKYKKQISTFLGSF